MGLGADLVEDWSREFDHALMGEVAERETKQDRTWSDTPSPAVAGHDPVTLESSNESRRGGLVKPGRRYELADRERPLALSKADQQLRRPFDRLAARREIHIMD